MSAPEQEDDVTRAWLEREWIEERERCRRVIAEAERKIEYINEQLAKRTPKSKPDELQLF